MFEFNANCDNAKYGLSLVEGDYFKWWNGNPFKHKTRNNKIRLGKAFEKMRQTAEYYLEYCKSIPEEENEHHAEIVNRFTEDMEKLEELMGKIINDDIYKDGYTWKT